MSRTRVDPFSPERLARLARFAAEVNAATAPPPFAEPIVMTQHGRAWIPDPDRDGTAQYLQIHAGVRLGWTPVDELGGALIALWSISPKIEERDGFATFISRDALRALAAALEAIAGQIGGDR